MFALKFFNSFPSFKNADLLRILSATQRFKDANVRNFAETKASLKIRRHVTFPSKNAIGEVNGVICGDKNNPGLVLLHEWWGLNEQIIEEANTIAKDGKLQVVVPDLYRGKVASDRETAGHLMGGLDWGGALKDISGCAKFLQTKGSTKVGIAGFCMGGALALAAAVRCPEFGAAVAFYGIPTEKAVDLKEIRIPIQLHFGETDDIVGFSSLADYKKLVEKLTAAGVKFEGHTYKTGHAFTNPTNPNYSKEFTTVALERMYAFLHANLK